MITEKRNSRRRPLHHNARILIAPEQFLECRLSNVSEAGALIEVADTDALPDRFLLVLAARGAVRRTCQVVRREPNQVGVAFVSPTAQPAKRKAAPQQPAAENKPATEHPKPN